MDSFHFYKMIIGNVVDWVLPPRCVVSGEVVDRQGSLSAGVWSAINFISDPFCETCGVPFEFLVDGKSICPACQTNPPLFRKARSAVIYDDDSRNLILRFKHADQTHMTHSFLPWMMRAGGSLLEETDLIVPVPLHPMRLFRRRYNQAALLTQVLAKTTEKPCLLDAVRRVKATPTQGRLTYKKRQQNVKDAFAVNPSVRERIEGQKILLVDDVYTSGATIKECTKVLLANRAVSVDVLTLARVVRPEYIL